MAELDFNSLDLSKGKEFKKEDFILALEKTVDELFSQTVDPSTNFLMFSMGLYMSLSKKEAMSLYNCYPGIKVYFVNKEGWWLLDRFGDITLTEKRG